MKKIRKLFYFKKGDEIIFDCVTKIYMINRLNQKSNQILFEKQIFWKKNWLILNLFIGSYLYQKA